VIEVIGPRSYDERDRSRLERRGRFIGRSAQLAQLEQALARAIGENRRVAVLVTGAAGIGKSRLVDELLARRSASGASARVVRTGANPASHHSPFALVIDFYQAALGVPPARGRAVRGQVVQRMLHLMRKAHLPEERARAFATDLDRAMELRDGVGVGTIEVADLRPRISAGLGAFRGAMIAEHVMRPLVTVIEDLHQADGPSIEVLRHTLAVPAAGTELLVLTSRPEGLDAPMVDVTIDIGDLAGPELRALAAERLGDAATPLNIAAVISRGGGNPLFVEELAQAVSEAGEDVPASVRDVVAARVDRASPKAKVALRLAAVMGNTVRARLVEELLAEDDQGDEGPNPLDELVDTGFLVRGVSTAGSTEGELYFARGLVREVIYESLSGRAQKETHARLGRLLASRFFAGREEPPAVIADHLERGGELAGASAFWLRAGRLAMTASDAHTAVSHFTRTLANERELGLTPPTPAARTRRREAYAGREQANRLRGDLGSDVGDLEELQRLCEGDPRRLADVAIRRAHRLLRLGDYAGATVATVAAEEHGASVFDGRLVGEALRVRGEILERLGRFDEALGFVDRARQMFAREGAVGEELQALVGRGRIHLMRAHYEAARDVYRSVVARVGRSHDPWIERVVQNHMAIIEMCLGNYPLAMASAQRSLDLCRRYGDRAREGEALSVAGIIQLEVGLFDAAASTFEEALELLARTGSRWSRADCLIYAGLCEVRRGRNVGIAMINEALAEAQQIGARYLEANALITRAGARLLRGEHELAVEDAAQGSGVARLATLVGYEIQGLARNAVALVRRSRQNVAEAHALVHRALALLEQQRYLEGSEEEVYVHCVEVLELAGVQSRADLVKARGRGEVARKLAGLTDPAWREAYAALPECKRLLETP
jgi:tetratricopeptide (TPR) repeat protein